VIGEGEKEGRRKRGRRKWSMNRKRASLRLRPFLLMVERVH